MDIKTLVGQDIEEGRKLVETLEKLMPITAAFWNNDENTNRWSLMIITPVVAESGPFLAHRLVDQALAESKAQLSDLDVSVGSPVRLEYKRLRSRRPNSHIALQEGPPGPPWRAFSGDSYIYILN